MKFPSYIGLDLAGRNLGMAQFSRNGNKYTVIEAAMVPKRDRDEGLSAGDAQRVRDLMEKRRFSGVRIVATVPIDMQLLGSFEIPPPESGAPIGDITRAELAREAKLSDHEIESDWWVLPATGKNGDVTRAIVVGLAHEQGRLLVNTLVDQGFDPVAFDVRGLAILRACGHLLEGSGKVSTFVEIGDFSTLTCVCLDNTIVYYRRVDEGLETIIQDVMREMNVDASVAEVLLESANTVCDEPPAQVRDLNVLVNTRLGQLAQTVRAAIAYASHRYPHAEIGNILVFGTGADALDVVPTFNEIIGISIRRVTLGDVCGDTSHPLHSKASLIPAAGLAMYGVAA